jgi:hypothetical protein
MTYYECVACRFNVTTRDERCVNCGILRPLESIKVEKEDYSFLIAVVIILSILIPALYFGSQAGGGGIVCCALPLGVVLAVVLGSISKAVSDAVSKRSEESGARRLASRKALYSESLEYKASIIKQRVEELAKREKQLVAVLDRARENTGEKWDQVRTTLEASIQTPKRQRARYSAKALEIDMVRLQNKLAPFIYDTGKLSYEQIDGHLKVVEEAQTKAVGLGKQLNEQRQVLGSVREIEELSQRLAEIQESTGKLRDALVGQQAVLALKDITPLDDALTPILPPMAAIRESEVFNMQVAITDFSASFDELESEYVRVQSEEEVAQKVNEIINRG